MKRVAILFAALIGLWGSAAHAQALVNCIAGTTPCNSSASVGTGTQGDPLWKSFGKINENFSGAWGASSIASSAIANASLPATNLSPITVRSNAGSAMADTLPSAAGSGAGARAVVVNADASAIDTITPAAGTVGGGAAFVLTAGQTATFYSDGANWQVFSGGCASTCAASVTTLTASGAITANGGITDTVGITANAGLTVSGSTLTRSGNQSAAAWGTNGVGFVLPPVTFTDTTSSGTVTNTSIYEIGAPTLAASAATTYTNATTLVIAGAPIQGTNATISNSRGLDVTGAATFRTGLVATGGTITFANNSGTNTSNIGTGSTTGTVAIGGGSNAVTISATTATINGVTVGSSGLITPLSTVGTAGTVGADNAQAGSVGEVFTVYCGGDTTATITVTIASPAVVTWASHPFSSTGPAAWECPINFTTSSALPTGIVAGTNYYIDGSTLSGDTFEISDTAAHAIAGTNHVNTSGSQSGTQTGWMGALASNLAVFGASGMSITAGDWDCNMVAIFSGVSSVTATAFFTGINTSAGSLPSQGNYTQMRIPSGVIGTADEMPPGVVVRENVSSTTPIYGVGESAFSGGSQNVSSRLTCRRMR